MASESEKICILLKSVGNAPVLKKDKFMLGKTTKLRHDFDTISKRMYDTNYPDFRTFLKSWKSYVINFLSKKMCEPDERIFIYIHQSFSPTPDTSVGLLFDNYSRYDKEILLPVDILYRKRFLIFYFSDGKLVLHYSKSPAWG